MGGSGIFFGKLQNGILDTFAMGYLIAFILGNSNCKQAILDSSGNGTRHEWNNSARGLPLPVTSVTVCVSELLECNCFTG
jgi:hypothetical protein